MVHKEEESQQNPKVFEDSPYAFVFTAFAVYFELVEQKDDDSYGEVEGEAEGLGCARDDVQGEQDEEGCEVVADVLEAVEKFLDAGGVFFEFLFFCSDFVHVCRDVFLTFFILICLGSFVIVDGVDLFFDEFVDDHDGEQDEEDEPHENYASLDVLGLLTTHYSNLIFIVTLTQTKLCQGK